MAEGILRKYVGDRYEVSSAGTHPSSVRPEAVAVMEEWGESIVGQRSKSAEEFVGREIAYVITVCGHAAENCPVFPQAVRRIHWPFEDPAAVQGPEQERLAAFRRVRDQIAARFRAFPPPAIRVARAEDRIAVDALLASAKLVPVDEASQFGKQWVVAESAQGAVVGCGGLEVWGGDGLLRSVAVVEELRGAGTGRELAQSRIDWAREQGLEGLYLLTTTAAGYWPRFGFERIARDEAPAEIRRSVEWASACPASATAMRLRLR